MTDVISPQARIGSVHLAVRDLERETGFYERRIGLRASPTEGGATLSAGGEVLLRLWENPRASLPRRTTGLYHLAILLPSRPWLARTLGHLIQSETPISGASDHGVSEALYLSDPEGNGIEIYRDRPREEWSRDGDEVRMVVDPLDLEGLLAEAAPSAAWDGLPPETRIGHIHLHVRDIDEARRFYVGVVGFQETARLATSALFVSAGGYHHHVGLNTWNGVGAPAPPPGSQGLRHYDILLPDDGEVGRIASRLRGAEISVEDGKEGLETADPSGNRIVLRVG
ncbi:MAG: VOC family protein [Candidatus Eiseniibacteriota bacterium]